MKSLFLILVLSFPHISYGAENDNLKLLSTTSTRDSGFLEYMLPKFEKKYNIKVHVIALGTGQALHAAKNCNGDILLTHAPQLEKEFIKNGYGISRDNLMHNDFVIIGPKNDPANIQMLTKASEVFKRISETSTLFISRGDDSGTNISENSIWKKANINPNQYSGTWYLESGQGMGATLNIAIGMNSYTYSDRATWLKFKNKNKHTILFEGDSAMFNQYALIKINPQKCRNLNINNINYFYSWIISPEGKLLISNYIVNGVQLFTPNYINDK